MERGFGGLGQQGHVLREGVNAARVTSASPGGVAGEHALKDARQLPIAKGLIIRDVAYVEAGGSRIGIEDLGTGRKASGRRRGGAEQCHRRVARLRPIDEQEPKVGQWVAQGTDLPVQDRLDLAFVVENGVVESVVPMDDGRTLLLGDLCGESIANTLDEAAVVDALDGHLLVLSTPPLQLASDVALLAGEVSETDGIDIDFVERGERGGQVGADGAAHGWVKCSFCFARVSQDVALHELHDVERAIVHRLVGAEPESGGDRHVRATKSREDGVLAHHVMSGREDVTGGRSPQRHAAPCGVGHPVGQVRTAPSHELKGEGTCKASNVLGQPVTHVGDVDSDRFLRGVRHPTTLPPPSGRSAGWTGNVGIVIDVTDATFESLVLERSHSVPVVVDLWATWCGPCVTLGPMLEAAVARRAGAVELAKVDVDANPGISRMFEVQSIPAVFALRDGEVIDGFIGAVGEAEIESFLDRINPPPSETDLLVAQGDEASLRAALAIEPGHGPAILALARIVLDGGRPDEALELLARIPETAEVRTLLAEARLARQEVDVTSQAVAPVLDELLGRVATDEAARQEYLDLLETLGPDNPLTARYRKALAATLF